MKVSQYIVIGALPFLLSSCGDISSQAAQSPPVPVVQPQAEINISSIANDEVALEEALKSMNVKTAMKKLVAEFC